MTNEQETRNNERVAVCGLACSALALAAGFIAKVSASGVAIASVLLTLAGVVACAGVAIYRGARWSLGVGALLSAALLVFGAFYGIGRLLLRALGQAMAGDLLIAVAAILPVVAIFSAANHHRRAAPGPLARAGLGAQRRRRL
jgi:hypothetical protein